MINKVLYFKSKIMMMFALVMGFAVSTFAQTALVDNGTAKDNWYIGGGVGTNVWNDGTSWTLFNAKDAVHGGNTSWWRSQPLHINVYGGKMFNPYLGVEVDYAGGFNIHGSKTFIDTHNLSGNLVVNLTNVIGGYNGVRRGFEVELLGGAGWLHAFDGNQNGVTARGAIRGNINVSKSLAITITPEYVYTVDAFDFGGAHGANLSVGIKYRFPSKRGNFPLKQLRSQSEIDALNATIDGLKAANAELTKANADLAATIKKLVEDGQNVKADVKSVGTVYFSKGASDVTSDKVAKVVDALKATNGKITLTGTTSPEGSEKFNKALAQKRANAVKEALVKSGIVSDRISVTDNYDSQRSVVITVE